MTTFTCSHCGKERSAELFPFVCGCRARHFADGTVKKPRVLTDEEKAERAKQREIARAEAEELASDSDSFTEKVGTNLHRLIRKLRLKLKPGCGCGSKMVRMNRWGIAGCKEHRDEILGWLRESQQEMSWGETIKAATMAVLSGLALKLDPSDPAPGMLDEAIRLAEEATVS